MSRIFVILAFFVVISSCSPSENESNTSRSEIDPNLKCAAFISATSFLIEKGQVSRDAISSKKDGLVIMMTYLNTYAIPKKLKESEAFEELNSNRETLTSSLSSSEIVNETNKCMNNSPL